jgi:oligoendopeptidase F
LAALRLLARRRDDPARFGADYVAMLDATGTGTPAELLARCGLDVGASDVWERGLAELDRLCELAW